MEEVTEQTFVGKSEINNIFDLPPTQIAIVDGDYVTHRCSEVSDEQSIVFDFLVDAKYYADLTKSYLTFDTKIEGADATNNKVGPVNLWGHSCFRGIKVTLNDELVTDMSDDMYPYESMLTTLLSYGADAKKTHLFLGGYSDDTSGKMDSYDPTDPDCNPGLVRRATGINTGSKTELLMRPHINIFQQERLLPPGTKVRMTLYPTPSNFNLMADATGSTKYKTKIANPRLHLRRVELSSTTQMAHITEKQNDNAMRYPVRELKTKQKSIYTGSSDYEETVYNGVIPRRVWIGMVEQAARTGSYKKNPFNFQHFDMSSIQLKVGGRLVPSEPLEADFENNLYKEMYFHLFSQMDNMFDDHGNGITYEDFKNGFCIMAFDLTADMEDGEHLELKKRGTVDLKIRFKNPVTTNISVICAAEYENVVSITGRDQKVSKS